MLDGLPIDEPPPDYPTPKDYSTPPQKPNPKIQTNSKPKWTLIDTYHYYDGNGQLQYKIDKFLVGDKKQFIPSRYENGQKQSQNFQI